MKRLRRSQGSRQLVKRAVGAAIESLEQRVLLSFSAVTTYENASLYWDPAGGSSSVQATVRYKVAGTSTWNNAQDLWFAPAENGRPAEYRGSVLGLKSNTAYDVELDLAGATPPETYQFTTRNDNFPIAQTIVVTDSSTPLEINNVNGTANGYILYTGPATIDVANAHPYNIRIQNSSYVIIRGLTLKGATGDGILLGSSTSNNSNVVKDIVIEDNDISGWGSVIVSSSLTAAEQQLVIDNNWGWDDQSGIRSSSTNLERITVQRNRIHDPRTDSNSWKETNPYIDSMHPYGPQGITFEYGTKGGFVIRYNEITSDNNHRFNDGMGADQNFGYGGFPARDSDIYGNVVTYTWDDAYEIEGANMNVRVYGNYADMTYTGAAIAGTSMGPLYVFRNVFGRSQTSSVSGYTSYGGGAFKRQGSSSYPSNGRMYIYNNTLYNQSTPMFQSGVGQSGSGPYASNTIVRNNILRVRNSSDKSINDPLTDSSGSSYDYDLYNGQVSTPNYVTPQETHGLLGTPTYVAGSGFNATTGQGIFQLTSASLGYDDGLFIANITDGYNGLAPDIGAHEAGTAPMEFGVNAYKILPGVWDGPATGSWLTASNWTLDDIPDTAAENARIDNDSSQNTIVTWTVPAGGSGVAGVVTVDSGDTLTLNKTAGSSSAVTLSGILNSGTVNFNHTSLDANYQNYTLTLTGLAGTLNAAGANLNVNMGASRRGIATLNVPVAALNAGTLQISTTSGGSGYNNLAQLVFVGSGTFTNNGIVLIRGAANSTSSNNDAQLTVQASSNVTLDGTGTVTLASRQGTGTDSYALIKGGSGATLTNAATHTIQGSGYIGEATFSSITNLGLILADGNVVALVINPATAGTVTNSSGGRMVAAGTAGMTVGATGKTFTNNGVLEARSGSSIALNGTLVINGTVAGAGTYVAPTLQLSTTAALEVGNRANSDGTGASTVGLMSVTGNLALGGSTAVNVQLGATTTRGSTYDAINVSGNLTLDGVLNVTDNAGFGAGTYRLFNFAAGGLTNNTLSLGSMPAGYTYSIVTNASAGTVDLVVTSGGAMAVAPTTASASGSLFFDTNANGTWDSAETAQARKQVYIDLDRDGALDTNEPTVKTNSSGKFVFNGLAPGNYTIRRVVPGGYRVTTPLIQLDLQAGDVVTGLLIGTTYA